MGELSNTMAFNYNDLNVRVIMANNEPWFVATDVCNALEIKDTSRAVNGNKSRGDSGLDDDEKGTYIVRTPGGDQSLLCVNEPGLYSLIMKSRKPEAKEFKRWVTHDVLPQIRKTGQYTLDNKLPQTYIEALEALVQAEKSKLLLQQNVEEMQPKAEAYNVLLSGKNAQTMSQVAKSCGTGRNRLFKLLRDRGILMKNNLPYQEYIERGYFKVREVTTIRKDKTVNVTQTLVTARGIDIIRGILDTTLTIS